jgi:hypothetical protein
MLHQCNSSRTTGEVAIFELGRIRGARDRRRQVAEGGLRCGAARQDVLGRPWPRFRSSEAGCEGVRGPTHALSTWPTLQAGLVLVGEDFDGSRPGEVGSCADAPRGGVGGWRADHGDVVRRIASVGRTAVEQLEVVMPGAMRTMRAGAAQTVVVVA